MHNPRMPPRSLALEAGIAALCALAGTGCGSSVDERPAKWSFISASIVEPGCATVSCHSAISQRGGVDLHAREVGFYMLINGFYVIPNLPDQSTVVSLMNAEGALRMPPDVPLPQADIALIETWITDGAPNN